MAASPSGSKGRRGPAWWERENVSLRASSVAVDLVGSGADVRSECLAAPSGAAGSRDTGEPARWHRVYGLRHGSGLASGWSGASM